MKFQPQRHKTKYKLRKRDFKRQEKKKECTDNNEKQSEVQSQRNPTSERVTNPPVNEWDLTLRWHAHLAGALKTLDPADVKHRKTSNWHLHSHTTKSTLNEPVCYYGRWRQQPLWQDKHYEKPLHEATTAWVEPLTHGWNTIIWQLI